MPLYGHRHEQRVMFCDSGTDAGDAVMRSDATLL